MMNRLVPHLDRILEYLRKLRRPIVHRLRNGVDGRHIEKVLGEAGLPSNKEIFDLWQWRNGTVIEPGTMLDDIHFFPGFYLFSVEDAVTQYLAMEGDGRWNRAWLPIFANGGGDFYAADFSRTDADSAPIIGFLLGQEEHPTEYESLEKMCETVSVCFERGVFFVSREGYLEMDDASHSMIARQLNPTLEIWK